jgi:hypothetical protein
MGAGQNRPDFTWYDCLELLKWAQGLYIGVQPKFLHIPHGGLCGANLVPKLWV